MSRNLKVEEEYQKVLEEAKILPDGKWYAGTSETHQEFGFKLTPTIKIKGPFKSALKAMKKAKRMAVWKDIFSWGSPTGVLYWINKKGY